jgi:hypothetical protein
VARALGAAGGLVARALEAVGVLVARALEAVGVLVARALAAAGCLVVLALEAVGVLLGARADVVCFCFFLVDDDFSRQNAVLIPKITSVVRSTSHLVDLCVVIKISPFSKFFRKHFYIFLPNCNYIYL